MTLDFLARWLLGTDLGSIPNWTPQRRDQYQKETLKYLGRGETAYTWSKTIKKKQTIISIAQGKRAS